MLEEDHAGCWDVMNSKGKEKKPGDQVRGGSNYPGER